MIIALFLLTCLSAVINVASALLFLYVVKQKYTKSLLTKQQIERLEQLEKIGSIAPVLTNKKILPEKFLEYGYGTPPTDATKEKKRGAIIMPQTDIEKQRNKIIADRQARGLDTPVDMFINDKNYEEQDS